MTAERTPIDRNATAPVAIGAGILLPSRRPSREARYELLQEAKLDARRGSVTRMPVAP